MATLLQVTCLILILGMAHGWEFPSMFDQSSPFTQFHGSNDNNSTSAASMFKDLNKMMATMHQRFQKLFDSPSFSMNHVDSWMEDRKKLDAVEPVCTTATSSSPPLRQIKRKKLRNTQTTTCVKELIIDEKKHFYKEMNVTDEKGVLISQSKVYQTISINRNNNTAPINIDGDRNVISY
jgi:hypothetical protein